MTYRFEADLWVHIGENPWYFVTLPPDQADDKGMTASLSITYLRNPIVPQSAALPANGFTMHDHMQGVQLSVTPQTNPDGGPVYYRFVLCVNPSWAACTVVMDSGFTTSASYNSGAGAGLPASFYNTQYYWGVVISTAPTGTIADWSSSWMNSWKLYNNAPADPQLLSPVDGFRWAPNAPPTFTIARQADPDGDAVEYRLVVREPGSSGAVWRSDWSGLAAGAGNLSFTIPALAPLRPVSSMNGRPSIATASCVSTTTSTSVSRKRRRRRRGQRGLSSGLVRRVRRHSRRWGQFR